MKIRELDRPQDVKKLLIILFRNFLFIFKLTDFRVHVGIEGSFKNAQNITKLFYRQKETI